MIHVPENEGIDSNIQIDATLLGECSLDYLIGFKSIDSKAYDSIADRLERDAFEVSSIEDYKNT